MTQNGLDINPSVTVHELLEEYPDFIFKIIGHVYSEVTTKHVEKLGIKNKVIFANELSHDAIQEELKKSDLYFGIFSGKYTALGSATIESMIMGVPVISNAPADLFGDISLIDMKNYVYTNTNDLNSVVNKVKKVD